MRVCECSGDATVQQQRILVTQAIYRATHTHVLIHNLHMYLSPLSSDITTLAETQRWHTVYWTEPIVSTHIQSANHAHPLRPRTTSVSITAFTPVMLSGCCTKHTQSTWITCSYSYSSTETIMFNLALFMGFIIEHTCTVRDVDTDRRATWTFIFQI